ncbi:hypothetical protein BD560DRAFT_122977 [Blakeslea trispora]|nr:hypothetical protein BD560DRAFT_122977 [Blakeslea trispora]
MIRCNLNKSHQLELILIMSLLTLLDKSNDGEWKKDNVSQEIAVPLESIKKADEKRIQQKKQKAGQLNDLKLEMMLEKDARRSRKQMQMDEKRLPVSAGNSPLHSPKMSPLPTPTTSLNHVTMLDDFRLQQHPSNLDVYGHPNKMLSSIHYDHGPFRMKPDTTVKPYEFGGYERTSSGFLNMNGQSRKKY